MAIEESEMKGPPPLSADPGEFSRKACGRQHVIDAARQDRVPWHAAAGGAHVDGGDGEVGGAELAATTGRVQLVDGGRATAQRLRGAPDHPARGIPHGRGWLGHC